MAYTVMHTSSRKISPDLENLVLNLLELLLVPGALYDQLVLLLLQVWLLFGCNQAQKLVLQAKGCDHEVKQGHLQKQNDGWYDFMILIQLMHYSPKQHVVKSVWMIKMSAIWVLLSFQACEIICEKKSEIICNARKKVIFNVFKLH